MIRMRIGIKPGASHEGGFTIFGRGFGNYEQDLVLRLHYLMDHQAQPTAATSAAQASD
jgi:predicted transcriptional regulator